MQPAALTKNADPIPVVLTIDTEPDNAWENRFYCTLVPCLESPRGRPVEVTAIAVAPRPRLGGIPCSR